MEQIQKIRIIKTRRPNGTVRIQTFNDHPTLTAQDMNDECDINYIMDKFQKTGSLTHRSSKQGIYGDVSQVPDLLGASILVKESHDKFQELPAELRLKFSNDPVKLYDYLSNPLNAEEAKKLGLLNNPSPTLNNDDLNDDDGQTKVKKAQKPAKSEQS